MSDGVLRPRRVTLTDVAERAGVDKAVVSRVVNADPKLAIRPETRARVVAAIAELDYQPNATARSLRTARTRSIGLFIPDFSNPIYGEIMSGAEEAATAHGYALVTGSAAVEGRRTRQYLDLLGAGRVDGLLLAGGRITPADRDSLDAGGVPWLSVNRRIPGSRRYLVLDDEAAARLAVEHLVDLGHRRIAHIAGPDTADTARRRRKGWATALAAAGLEADPELVEPADYTPGGGGEAVERLLERAPAASAIFVANVASAIGVLAVLRWRGVRVPEQVSVVAVHDLPLAEYLSPALTTVAMPLRELGSRAVQVLLGGRADEAVGEVVREPIHLVVRDSTAPVPGGAGRALG